MKVIVESRSLAPRRRRCGRHSGFSISFCDLEVGATQQSGKSLTAPPPWHVLHRARQNLPPSSTRAARACETVQSRRTDRLGKGAPELSGSEGTARGRGQPDRERPIGELAQLVSRIGRQQTKGRGGAAHRSVCRGLPTVKKAVLSVQPGREPHELNG